MHKSGNRRAKRKGPLGVAADSYYLRRFYCEYRKINCRRNRVLVRSPRPFSRPPCISLIWQLWNQIYSLLRASYTIYRRGIDGDLAIDKRGRGDTYSRRYRYSDTFPISRWMEVGINGGVTKSYTRIAIVRAWKARDKYRRRIIDTITFTYRYELYPARVRTSFTTHCYFPRVRAPLRRRRH